MEERQEEAENARRRRRGRVAKNKEKGVIMLHPPLVRAPATAEVKLAALAVDLNIRLRSAEMPCTMQERAFRYTTALLKDQKPNPTHLAMSLKKEFDATYGLAWHCIVGKSFGSFVTHSSGGFVYFSVEKLSFLLFKTVVQPVKSPSLLKLNSDA